MFCTRKSRGRWCVDNLNNRQKVTTHLRLVYHQSHLEPRNDCVMIWSFQEIGVCFTTHGLLTWALTVTVYLIMRNLWLLSWAEWPHWRSLIGRVRAEEVAVQGHIRRSVHILPGIWLWSLACGGYRTKTLCSRYGTWADTTTASKTFHHTGYVQLVRTCICGNLRNVCKVKEWSSMRNSYHGAHDRGTLIPEFRENQHYVTQSGNPKFSEDLCSGSAEEQGTGYYLLCDSLKLNPLSLEDFEWETSHMLWWIFKTVSASNGWRGCKWLSTRCRWCRSGDHDGNRLGQFSRSHNPRRAMEDKRGTPRDWMMDIHTSFLLHRFRISLSPRSARPHTCRVA